MNVDKFEVSKESYKRYKELVDDFRVDFIEIKSAMNDKNPALAMDIWHEAREKLKYIQNYFEGSYVVQ